ENHVLGDVLPSISRPYAAARFLPRRGCGSLAPEPRPGATSAEVCPLAFSERLHPCSGLHSRRESLDRPVVRAVSGAGGGGGGRVAEFRERAASFPKGLFRQ